MGEKCVFVLPIVVIQKLCFHGNVTSHLSSLKIPFLSNFLPGIFEIFDVTKGSFLSLKQWEYFRSIAISSRLTYFLHKMIGLYCKYSKNDLNFPVSFALFKRLSIIYVLQ